LLGILEKNQQQKLIKQGNDSEGSGVCDGSDSISSSENEHSSYAKAQKVHKEIKSINCLLNSNDRRLPSCDKLHNELKTFIDRFIACDQTILKQFDSNGILMQKLLQICRSYNHSMGKQEGINNNKFYIDYLSREQFLIALRELISFLDKSYKLDSSSSSQSLATQRAELQEKFENLEQCVDKICEQASAVKKNFNFNFI